jgi:transcriptional regulator with XRE-family HTH domain
MKNMMNKKMDKLALTRNHPAYKKFLDITGARVKLAVEVSEARALKGWTQQKLAQEVETTQKVISKIESGDTNIGFDLLTRVARHLDLEFQVGKTVFAGKAEAIPDRVADSSTSKMSAAGLESVITAAWGNIGAIAFPNNNMDIKPKWAMYTDYHTSFTNHLETTTSKEKSDEIIKNPQLVNV